MKQLSTLLLIILSALLTTSIAGNKPITMDEKKALTYSIVKDHAHEHALKYGLGHCLKKKIQNPELKDIMNQEQHPFLHPFLYRHYFYNNIDTKELTTLEMHVIWPYIDKLVEIFPHKITDIDVMEKCLTIYNSDEFRELVQKYDYAIDDRIDIFSNVYSTLPKLVPYRKLTGDQFELSKSAFYQCLLLRDDLKDQTIHDQLTNKINDITNNNQSSIEFYESLLNHYLYLPADFNYSIREEGPNGKLIKTVQSGCLTLFDSNNLNFLFD